jgi:hypothetical protein
MKTHPRAKLGPAARQELCELIERGETIRGVARWHTGAPFARGAGSERRLRTTASYCRF